MAVFFREFAIMRPRPKSGRYPKGDTMKTKTLSLTIAAVLLAGCSDLSSGNFKGIPYAGGDICEWAKQNLIATQQAFNDGELDRNYGWAERQLKQAQRTVIASCHTEEEKDGAWACAEGHSCK
ncbi:MAG: hypothetical protein ACR2QC_11360 [Gammaproteobacteria bacterium]